MRRKRVRNSDAIKVEVVGGLGNQLFCYFAGVFVAERLGVSLRPYSLRRSEHESSLDSFDLAYPLEKKATRWCHAQATGRAALRRFLLLSGFSKRFSESVSKIHISSGVGHDLNLITVPKGSTIQGYFQSQVFFLEASKSPRHFPIKLRQPSEWYNIMSKLLLFENPFVIHIRRGDYTSELNSDIGVLSGDYFVNALNSLASDAALPPKPVWIFSDDIESAKRDLKFPPHFHVRWIEPPERGDPAESLMLMSSGSALVISNSTFSWWAAALSTGRPVVAPSKWFKNMEDPELMIPSTWKRSPSKWKT